MAIGGGGRVGVGNDEAGKKSEFSSVAALLYLTAFVSIGIVLVVIFSLQSKVAKLEAVNGKVLEQINELVKNCGVKFYDNEASNEEGHCTREPMTSSMDAFSAIANSISTNLSEHLEVILEKYVANVSYNQCNPKDDGTFTSCADILQHYPTSPSGYYSVKLNGGCSIEVFCDMTMSCGGIAGGWRRIAYLNIHEGAQCPMGLKRKNNPPSCKRSESMGGCTPVMYKTGPIPYTHICGRINAIHFYSLDGFLRHSDLRPEDPTIDDNYVDGVSLSLLGNEGTRCHIWTLAAADCKFSSDNVPPFVGGHYSFDCGTPGTGPTHRGLLWDEHQCPSTPSTPAGNESWFYRKLPQNSLDNVEMRVCRDQDRADEDLFIQRVDIYVQ